MRNSIGRDRYKAAVVNQFYNMSEGLGYCFSTENFFHAHGALDVKEIEDRPRGTRQHLGSGYNMPELKETPGFSISRSILSGSSNARNGKTPIKIKTSPISGTNWKIEKATSTNEAPTQ